MSTAGGDALFRSRGAAGRGMLTGMSDLSQLLEAAAAGDRQAAADVLPLVYDELRKLAAARLARENPGQTLQPTALVHEAYLRLAREPGAAGPRWAGRGQFFAAAAEAMRRILVESARRKSRLRHGGDRERVEIDDQDVPVRPTPEEILALDEALTRLAAEHLAADELAALDFLEPSAKPGSLGRLGHYEVLEVVGRGGMGVVLRAFDEKLHRVAIKVLAPAPASNGAARQRFVREARAAAAVTHEN